MKPTSPLSIVSALALLSSSILVAAETDAGPSELAVELASGSTNADRIKLLKDEDFVFDFLHPPGGAGETVGFGGHTVAANRQTFPALIGNGVAMTIGFLRPCGLNTPHTHPRATEFNFVVNGTLRAGMLAENGARFIQHNVSAGSATVFPRGAIHFEQNLGCEPAIFVAGFNDEDPGVQQVAQTFFGLPPDIVGTTLGGVGVEVVTGIEHIIPGNVALGTDECLKRCGITRPAAGAKVPTVNDVPKADPKYLSSASGSASPSAHGSSSTLKTNLNAISALNPDGTTSNADSGSGSDSSSGSSVDSSLKPLLIALAAVNGLLVIVVIIGTVAMFRRPKNNGGAYSSSTQYAPSRAADPYDYQEARDSVSELTKNPRA